MESDGFDVYKTFLIRIQFDKSFLFFIIFQLNLNTRTNFVYHFQHIGWLKLKRLFNTNFLESAFNQENEESH